jgi:type 1 glutamine amidotransferase
MRLQKIIGTATLLGSIATVILAQPASAQTGSLRPGIDRPIRVGMFKGTGTSKYWHTNIHTAGAALASFLASPTTTGLGDSLIVPPAGFSFTQFGLAGATTGSPTAQQVTDFIDALDTLDVAYVGAFVDFGSVLSNTTQRQKLADFWTTKGFITSHASNDSYGTWAALDTIQATRFSNHPSSDRTATIRLDTAANTDPAWKYLNRSLADTNFLEEWFSYTTDGAVIRSKPFLKVTTQMDEATYNGGLGGARAMGTNHPHSWYRQLPTGGRYFYTGVGHRAQNFQGGTNPRFLRRQLYNAVLWVAKYDSLSGGTIAINPGKAFTGKASDYSKLSITGSSITVNVLQNTSHSVEILSVNGKRLALDNGDANRTAHTFTGLRSGVYALSVTTPAGRTSRLFTIQ